MSKIPLNFYGVFLVALYLLSGGAAHALPIETAKANELSPTAAASIDEATIDLSQNFDAANAKEFVDKNDRPATPISLASAVPNSTALPPVAANPDLPVAVNKFAASDALSILQNFKSRYECSKTQVDSGSSATEVNRAISECLEAMEAKLANAPNSVSQEDLAHLKFLALAFRSEAEKLGDRTTKVENQLAQKPQDSFSTTTKLTGEAIVAVSDVFGGSSTTGSTNTILSNRVRLVFRTTFTGKDLLLTRLQARNSVSFNSAAGTNTVRLGFEGSEDNAEYLHLLQYQFPVGSNTKVIASAVGNEPDSYLRNFNTLLAPAGTGSISRFGRYNTIYRLAGEGAGVTVDHKFSPQLGVALGYGVPRVPGTTTLESIASNPSNPVGTTGGGLFNGANLVFSQVNYSPNQNLDLGLIYARTYHPSGQGISGNNGSANANNPFRGAPTSAHHFSLLASTKLGSSTVLSGWAGLTDANRETAAGGNATIWNAAVTLAFNDVGGQGNTLGFVVGIPPTVSSNSVTGITANVPIGITADPTANRINRNVTYHLESFYKYKVSDNLSITPGAVLILNPEGNSASPALFLGTVRTTFVF
jgi:Carbohydrate-selective porin, OprB family